MRPVLGPLSIEIVRMDGQWVPEVHVVLLTESWRIRGLKPARDSRHFVDRKTQ